MKETVIKVKNLSKSFQNKKILKEINFEIYSGEIFSIVGKSGTGKTVLLRCLTGLLAPDEGEIEILGTPIKQEKDWELIRPKIGLLFQEGALFDSMTVGENIRFVLKHLTNWPDEKIEKRIGEVLELVGLKGTQNMYPDELSGGMKKRLAIARTISYNPELVFFDEPTSGLDPVTANQIIKLIVSLNQELMITCVLISHDLQRILRISHRLLFLENGQVYFVGEPESILKSPLEPVKNFVKEVLEA